MGNCMPLNALDGDVALIFNGIYKMLKNKAVSFVRLQEKATRMCGQKEFALLSLSSAGNPLRINSEEI